ncbi:MAG: hypothetical protein NT159_24725 [Proteobacteria bacterium]|nr:hypothetical protein [Pseudomonadota bacterium]
MTADCLILTALSNELSSVLFQFRHFKPVVTSSKTTFPYFQTMAPNGLKVIAGMQTGMGSLAAASLAQEAIATFQPKAVLLVGITGGMDHDIPLGDVVVSEQIVDYELGKVTEDGFSPRWSVYRPDARLLGKVKAWRSQSWQNYVRVPRPGDLQRPELHSGIYLSGNKVIADEQTAGALRSVWRKAAAIEMEASGVASVLWHMDRPPAFLVFKGVCDYADSKKNDAWQAYAADTAASCAFSFVLDHLGPADVAVPSPRTHEGRTEAQLQDRALREGLAVAYSIAELKVLSFDIGVDWEELPQGPKSQVIVELIQYVRRRGKFGVLVKVVNRDRDNLLSAFIDRNDE